MGRTVISGFATINSNAATSSIAGGAQLSTAPITDDLASILNGLTAGGALFTPNPALSGFLAGKGISVSGDTLQRNDDSVSLLSGDGFMRIECPRCNQDWVKKVRIGVTNRTVFLCYECEATWFCEDSIEFATFIDLSDYLGRKGLSRTKATYDTFEDDEGWEK